MTARVISPIKREIIAILNTEPDSATSEVDAASKINIYKSHFSELIPDWFYLEHPSHQSLIIDACVRLKHPLWSSKPVSEWVYTCSGAISTEHF